MRIQANSSAKLQNVTLTDFIWEFFLIRLKSPLMTSKKLDHVPISSFSHGLYMGLHLLIMLKSLLMTSKKLDHNNHNKNSTTN